jgi:hypothetical protein
LTIRGQIDCSSRTDALPGSFSADALGYPDYELREAAREAKEHAASFPLLAARFRLTGGSFALDKQSSTSVAALNENFSWHAEGDCVGVVSLIRADARTAANSAFLRAPFWLPKEWDFALHRRKTGLFLNQGYPLILDEQLEISLPPGTQLSALPALTENREGPLKWKVEWTKESEAKLRATFRAALAAGELSASEASAFQQQLRAMISALSTIIPL